MHTCGITVTILRFCILFPSLKVQLVPKVNIKKYVCVNVGQFVSFERKLGFVAFRLNSKGSFCIILHIRTRLLVVLFAFQLHLIAFSFRYGTSKLDGEVGQIYKLAMPTQMILQGLSFQVTD